MMISRDSPPPIAAIQTPLPAMAKRAREWAADVSKSTINYRWSFKILAIDRFGRQ